MSDNTNSSPESAAVPPPAGEPDASGDINTVARVTLDSAEVANRAAKAAAQTANKVAEAANRFDQAMAVQRRQMTIITGVCVGIAVLSLILFLAAAIQLRGRVVQINSVLTVMSKRTNELKGGLDNLSTISERLDAFSTQIDNIVQSQNRLRTSMQAAVQAFEQGGAVARAPVGAQPTAGAAPKPAVEPAESAQQRAAREQLARQTAEAAQSIAGQTKSIDAALKTQARTLSQISDRVAAIEQSLSGIPDLRRDTRQILDLEKQRAGSVAQALNDRQREEQLRRERERFVQFPATPGAASAGSKSAD
jgi:hypothetical protein